MTSSEETYPLDISVAHGPAGLGSAPADLPVSSSETKRRSTSDRQKTSIRPGSGLEESGSDQWQASESNKGMPAIIPALACWSLIAIHAVAIYLGAGGWSEIQTEWPIWRHDHPLYFHSAWITQTFLSDSGTTAGYDPYFMAGYPKSIVFPASSTLPELVVFFGGRLGADPVLTFKLYVVICVSLLPALVAAAAWVWGLRSGGIFAATLLFLVYLWSDFPLSYAIYGMIPYQLAVPLGLLVTGWIGRYLDRGGLGRWLLAALGSSLVVLVHITSAMTIVPAALLAYAVIAWSQRTSRLDVEGRVPVDRLTWSRHAGVWMIPVVVLTLNAFWWYPGLILAGTKGESGFAFGHSDEGIFERLLKILIRESPIQTILWTTGLFGLSLIAKRWGVGSLILTMLCGAGAFWGYAAGIWPGFDFLQPGRHTYVLYTGLCLSGGYALAWAVTRLTRDPVRSCPTRPSRMKTSAIQLALVAAILLGGYRMFGFTKLLEWSYLVVPPEGYTTFLSSTPSELLLWIDEMVDRHMEPGQRLLYEEGGKSTSGFEDDPYEDGRFSGLLPYRHGIEVIGGPYLHAALVTNFTQFGEHRLFERRGWDRGHFRTYVDAYRPSHILCWSQEAQRFCRTHPEDVEILEDRQEVLFARILGTEGTSSVGATVTRVERGRLIFDRKLNGDPVDEPVVLRYHTAPGLVVQQDDGTQIRPGTSPLGEDPVPLIELDARHKAGRITLDLSPW